MLRHVCTRWLSLFAAVERVIKSWKAIKKYFLELGQENCDKTIWNFIKSNEHELEEDLSSDISLGECYLFFVHHYMNILNVGILQLESNKLTITELHDVMCDLKNQIVQRLKGNFFGAKASSALKYLKPQEKQKFIKEATLVYEKTIDYFNKWYNFENTPLQYFTCLNLKKN